MSRIFKLLYLALLFGASCTSVPDVSDQVIAGGAEGWFDNRGEWTLYSEQASVDRVRKFEPPPKCINLINGTGLPKDYFDHLRGHKVRVIGETIMYEDLETEPGPYGQFAHHRLWNGEVVYGSCLRQEFIIARRMIRVK